MINEQMFVDPIGKVVNYWAGGEGGDTARIIKEVYPVKKYDEEIYREGTTLTFLAEKEDKTKVLITPNCYFGNKHPTGLNLYINWGLKFNYSISEDGEYAWENQDSGRKGYKL